MFWTPAAGHHKQNLWGALQIETFLAIPVGGEPAGIAVSADGTRAYVTSPEGKMLTVIDASHRKVLRQIKLAGGPLGVETLKVVKEVKVGDGPRAFGRFIRE